MFSQIVSEEDLRSAIAILDKYKYRNCEWSLGQGPFNNKPGYPPVSCYANGDFITTGRPSRITLTAFEAVAVAKQLEPPSGDFDLPGERERLEGFDKWLTESASSDYLPDESGEPGPIEFVQREFRKRFSLGGE